MKSTASNLLMSMWILKLYCWCPNILVFEFYTASCFLCYAFYGFITKVLLHWRYKALPKYGWSRIISKLVKRSNVFVFLCLSSHPLLDFVQSMSVRTNILSLVVDLLLVAVCGHYFPYQSLVILTCSYNEHLL